MKKASALSCAAAMLLASASMAGGAAPEKSDAKVSATASAAQSGASPLIDRSSKPRRVDAAECVNTGSAACVIAVRVGAKCAIALSPDALFVRRKAPVLILWHIETAGWEFAETDGVQFKGAPREFDDGRPAGPRNWQFRDRAENRGAWRYAVKVVDRNGQVCTLDPTVVNDWNETPPGSGD